jgi:hypothetical protein
MLVARIKKVLTSVLYATVSGRSIFAGAAATLSAAEYLSALLWYA